MADKPVEVLVFDFLSEQIGLAVYGDVLYEIDLHDTVYQSIKANRPRGIRISDAISELAPEPGGSLKEFNADVHVVCFAAVEGTDKKMRQEALNAVFAIQNAVVQLFYNNQSLGDRICDLRIDKTPRKLERPSDHAPVIAEFLSAS